MGTRFPGKPSDEGVPHLPTELGEIQDDELMELFSLYTQWANYMGPKVALAEIEEAQAESELEKRKALIMIQGWTGAKDERVALSKAAALVDDDVTDLVQAHAEAKAYRKLVGTLFANVERSSATVSRELTRRIGMAGKEGRVGKFNP